MSISKKNKKAIKYAFVYHSEVLWFKPDSYIFYEENIHCGGKIKCILKLVCDIYLSALSEKSCHIHSDIYYFFNFLSVMFF